MKQESPIAKSKVFYQTHIDKDLFKLISEKVKELSIKEKGYVGGNDDNSVVDLNIRDSDVKWWGSNHWVTSIFSHYFYIANAHNWEYDLTYLSQIQITKYTAGGFYTWHCDYGIESDAYDNTRKLSASLLMSDPSTFVGGDLEFIDYDGKKKIAPRELGSMVVFDSRIPHRVTQLTSGERISLVAWMYGPKLR